jgi:cryptochrome
MLMTIINCSNRRYVPELRNLPVEYLYEPWKAPIEVQREANCIIGQQYPERMVNHQDASARNRQVLYSLLILIEQKNPLRWK